MTDQDIIIFDRSVACRQILRECLRGFSLVGVVRYASDEATAAKMIAELKPEWAILEWWPGQEGTALRAAQQNDTAVLLTVDKAEVAERQADWPRRLMKLAFKDGDSTVPCDALKEAISRFQPLAIPVARRSKPADSIAKSSPRAVPFGTLGPGVLVIGVSTGGPQALLDFLTPLPADFPVPILIAQHMPLSFTRPLAENLDANCALQVSEAEEGDLVVAGRVLLAPGGYQTIVAAEGTTSTIRVREAREDEACRPCVNTLLRSAVDVYGARTLAMILTGMGEDGTEGCQRVREAGGWVLTQDEKSCVVYGMPRSVFDAGYSDEVCELEKMGARVMELCSATANSGASI